jgi:hypothetical protein
MPGKVHSWAALVLIFAGLVLSPVLVADVPPINPAVTQETLASTVCVAGDIKRVRPGSARRIQRGRVA